MTKENIVKHGFCIKSNIHYAEELQYISQMSAIDVYDYVKHFSLK